MWLLLLILIWLYFASCYSSDSFFNPYVNKTRKLFSKPVALITSVSEHISEKVAVAILFFVAIILRCLLARASYGDLFFLAGNMSFVSNVASFPKAILFCVVTFFIFLCQLNIIRFFLVFRFGQFSRNSVVQTFDTATLPLSHLPMRISYAATAVIVVLLLAILVPLSTNEISTRVNAVGLHDPNLWMFIATRMIKLLLFVIIDTLLIVSKLLIVLIVVSIGGLLAGSLAVSGMANEWLSAISRIVLKKPIAIGVIDLTPLLIYYAISFVHPFLVKTLAGF